MYLYITYKNDISYTCIYIDGSDYEQISMDTDSVDIDSDSWQVWQRVNIRKERQAI